MQMEKNQQQKPSSSTARNGLQHISITSTPAITSFLPSFIPSFLPSSLPHPHPESGKGSQEASNKK
jgi:hypothetical protein